MTLHSRSPLRVGVLAALLTMAVTAGTSGATPDVQTLSVTDTKGLITHTITAEVVDYQGRKAVKLTTPKDVEDGFAVLAGTDFQDGTIEADLAVKILTPPGIRMPGSGHRLPRTAGRVALRVDLHPPWQLAIRGSGDAQSHGPVQSRPRIRLV